jgi:hypothetical protein
MPTARDSIRLRVASAIDSGESGFNRMVIHSIGLRRRLAMLSCFLRVSIGNTRT